jgi:hypothetical protein
MPARKRTPGAGYQPTSDPDPTNPPQGKKAPEADIEQDVFDVVEAAMALVDFKQTGYGRKDPWWKREALWCHFCVRNIEMGQEHDEDCPALMLDTAVEKYRADHAQAAENTEPKE